MAGSNIKAWQVDRGTGVDQFVILEDVGGGTPGLPSVDARSILNLDTSQVTSGTFDDARIAQTNVTQHQGSLAIGLAQLTQSGAADGQMLTFDNSTSAWIPGSGTLEQLGDTTVNTPNENQTLTYKPTAFNGLIDQWSFTGATTINDLAADNLNYVYAASGSGSSPVIHKIDRSGNQVWVFNGFNYNTVTSVVTDPGDNNIYAGGTGPTSIKKIDSTGTEIWSVSVPDGPNDLTIDSTGTYLYAAIGPEFNGPDYSVRKYDTSNGNEITLDNWPFTGHTSGINAVVADQTGYIYSGSNDYTIRKLDSTGSEVWSFTGPAFFEVTALATDGSYVYSAARDDTVRKIDSSGNEMWSFTGHNSAGTYSVAVDQNSYVYSGGEDHNVRMLNASGNEIATFTNHTDIIEALLVHNGYVYSGGQDSNVFKLQRSASNFEWVNSSTTFETLGDVQIISPQTNDILSYVNGNWINQTPAEADLATASHTHDTADITSGTFTDARIAETNITQHEDALAIDLPQLTQGTATDGQPLVWNNTATEWQPANPVFPSYTVAGVPAATTPGQMIYVSDETGGAVMAFSDGTDWRRVTDRAVVA